MQPGEPVQGQTVAVVAAQPQGMTNTCGTVTVLIFAILFIVDTIWALVGGIFYIDDLSSTFRASATLFKLDVTTASGASVGNTGIGEWSSVPGLSSMAGPFKLATAMHIISILLIAVIAAVQVLRLAGCIKGYVAPIRFLTAVLGIVFLILTIVAHASTSRAVSNNVTDFQSYLVSAGAASFPFAYWHSSYVGWWISAYVFNAIFLSFTIRTFAGKGCWNCCCNCCSCAFAEDDKSSVAQPL